MPKHLDEAIVEDSLSTAVGRLGFVVRRERDQGTFRISIVRHLQVDDLAELAKVVVED